MGSKFTSWMVSGALLMVSSLAWANRPLPKTPVDQFLTQTCEKIRQKVSERSDRIERRTIRRATQYFTPLFEPGSDGGLQEADRRSCINIEGSCIVGKYLYNWVSRDRPWGQRYERDEVLFKFGKGSGENEFNTTNALDPCRTLAADPNVFPPGTVVYVPSMRSKKCPQTLKTVDGCFIVGDVGGAIKGEDRFDIFTGECADYNKRTNTCDDPMNSQFDIESGTTYYVVGRHNMLAKELREEVDLFIRNDWRSSPFPF